MIDTMKEELLSMSEAAKVCPAIDGKRPHSGSIWRWTSKGVGGVLLEHVRVGRRVCTSREALDRFFNRLAETPPPQRTQTVPRTRGRTPKERERAIAAAREGLIKRGIIPADPQD